MYKFSNKAADDLSSIYEYSFLNFGVKQADTYIEKLEITLDNLSDSPFQGRNCEDLAIGLRRYHFQQHTIYYRIKKNYLFIIRILHQQMDTRVHFS